MSRLASFVLASLALTGCLFVFDDDAKPCALSGGGHADLAPAAPIRDPYTLTCQSYGGWGGCDDACGPCPAQEQTAYLEPPPSWPVCGHRCESLTESQCVVDPECRVIKDAFCTFSPLADCSTDYLGCFPIDNDGDTLPATSCWRVGAEQCSSNSSCTAYHEQTECGTDALCSRPFAACAPEGQHPGYCQGQVTCRALPPTCPSGQVPGISNGCWTGACIRETACN